MTPVVHGPIGPNDHRRPRESWPTLLGRVPSDGNWYEFDEVDFDSTVQLRNAYQSVKRRYGNEFDFQTKTRSADGYYRLFARRKVSP